MVQFDESPILLESAASENGWKGRKLSVASMTAGSNGSANGGSNGIMNGNNGTTIATNGSTAATDKGCWTIGLINSKFKYLSAETFGFRINANGKSLKKKQIWVLEPSGDNETVVLRSHLGKYLAVDQFGNVTCDQDERDDSSKFEISVCDDRSGRWAFRSVTRGYFLGASADSLICSSKEPSDADLWFVHLAARPQVNLRSVGRKRFAHLSEEQDEIQVEANVPWGEDTLFTLEFREGPNQYAIHTSTGMYLQNDGKLAANISEDCFFSVEYHGGFIALRDAKNQYLAPIGSRAVLKTRSTTVTKDELFSLEDSLPQASFVAAANSRFVSVKQGVDVSANQEEISDHETFQLEFENASKKWYIRTMQDKYFTLQATGGVQANEMKRTENGLYEIIWHENGAISLKGNNGKFLAIKKSGHLFANAEDCADENARFFFYLMNRPVLVLKCEQGFVGYKATGSVKLECNKANYEMIRVERGEKGAVFFKGTNGKYIHFHDDCLSSDSDVPESFFLELRNPTAMCIKNSAGRFVNAEKNGCFGVGTTDAEAATQWEY